MNRHYVAEEGFMFSNGTIFVKELWLGSEDSLDNWPLVTEEQAKQIMAEEEAKAMNGFMV